MKRKKAYSELLSDKRWIKKRNEIVARDSFQCTNCQSKTSLTVHHKRYISGKNPWQYSNKDLITLCRTCHEIEHSVNKIKTYHTKQKNKISRIERMVLELSKEDKMLQLKYDKVLR